MRGGLVWYHGPMLTNLQKRILQRAKTAILADMDGGAVPERIASWQDLQGEVDANSYLLTRNGDHDSELAHASRFRIVDVLSPVVKQLDVWLRRRRSGQ